MLGKESESEHMKSSRSPAVRAPTIHVDSSITERLRTQHPLSEANFGDSRDRTDKHSCAIEAFPLSTHNPRKTVPFRSEKQNLQSNSFN